jgi:hypothetical protein
MGHIRVSLKNQSHQDHHRWPIRVIHKQAALHIFVLSKRISSARHLKSSHLQGPGPSGSDLESPHVDDILNPQTSQTQTDAERQAEATMADEKDKIAVADELQRYIEEGVLDEVKYKDFSLTRYWQVSDCLNTHSLKHQ